MGRLVNDITYVMGKKPRSVIHYIDANGKLTELPFISDTLQGAKVFEMTVKGEEQPKRWQLIYPPTRDELGRFVYICPYNALTNLNIDTFSKLSGKENEDFYWQEQFNTMLNYLEPALAKEWTAGVEYERRRQEGKKLKKKGLPIFTIMIIMGIVLVIVIFAILGFVYFSGGVV